MKWTGLWMLLMAIVAFTACESSDQKGEEIIQKAVEAHGGDAYKNVRINYDFRKKHYTTTLKDGRYHYQRTYEDTNGRHFHEVLSNDSLYRKIDGQRVKLNDKAQSALRGSLNSVNYFFLLPHKLTDDAVKPEYLGQAKIKEEPYHKVKVTFAQSGGGQDHEDIYLYWFHKDDYTMDYLAYKYFVDGGGIRFREAVNSRTKGGIRFADYLNFAPKPDEINFQQVESLYEEGQMEKVSEIRKEDIQVEDLD